MSKEVENSKQWHLRDAEEIENLESGKEVVLYFNDGSDCTGIFKSISDDLIILQSLDDKTNQIGLHLFENKKHNCRNCTACIYETKCTSGNMVNRVYCIHGIVDVVIGSDTNYFTDCERYAELFCAKILGIPLTESEA